MIYSSPAIDNLQKVALLKNYSQYRDKSFSSLLQ